MERLTERSENGTAVYLHPTREPEGWEANRAAVLERCCSYEDTGLTPEEIMDGRMLTGWIPVEERLPAQNMAIYASVECHNEVKEVRTAYYRDGDFVNNQGCALYKIIKAWQPRWIPMPYDPQG